MEIKRRKQTLLVWCYASDAHVGETASEKVLHHEAYLLLLKNAQPLRYCCFVVLGVKIFAALHLADGEGAGYEGWKKGRGVDS